MHLYGTTKHASGTYEARVWTPDGSLSSYQNGFATRGAAYRYARGIAAAQSRGNCRAARRVF
jgi:hypothetical protein